MDSLDPAGSLKANYLLIFLIFLANVDKLRLLLDEYANFCIIFDVLGVVPIYFQLLRLPRVLYFPVEAVG